MGELIVGKKYNIIKGLESDLRQFYKVEQGHTGDQFYTKQGGQLESGLDGVSLADLMVEDICRKHCLKGCNQFWHQYAEQFYTRQMGMPHLNFTRETAPNVYLATFNISDKLNNKKFYTIDDVLDMGEYGKYIGIDSYSEAQKNILEWRRWNGE